MNKNDINIMVILNYNDWQTVSSFVKQVQNYAIITAYIIVDNCSTDDSYEHLLLLRSNKIYVISTNNNNGYASGNNYGIQFAEQLFNVDNIIISNPDILVTENDIYNIITALHSGYAMATGVIYNYDPASNHATISSNFAWREPTYKDMCCNNLLLVYKIRRYFLKKSNYFDANDLKTNKYLKVEAVPGCFFAIKDSIIKKISYLDNETFLFGEETILGKKIKDAGFEACVVSNTKIFHENSVSIKKSIKAKNKIWKIRMNSDLVYLNKYLKCSKFQIMFYHISFYFGCLEKQTLFLFKNR